MPSIREVTVSEQQEILERRLFKLYDEEREYQQHENYPWVSEIPGYKACIEEIDHLETILADIEAAAA